MQPSPIAYATSLSAQQMAETGPNLSTRGSHPVKQVYASIADIESSNPALFEVIAGGAKELSTTPGLEHFDPAFLTYKELSLAEYNSMKIANTTSEDGRQKYMCVVCGKIHDRKDRAVDCGNAKLGFRPYRCEGGCGTQGCPKSYATGYLLKRHDEPNYKRYRECKYCHVSQPKNNLSRHMKSCGEQVQSM